MQKTRPNTSGKRLRGVLAAALVTCGLWLPVHAQTINAIMHAPVRVLDPVRTTAHITRYHGYMIYDTLLALDAQDKIQPQMLDRWEVSNEGRTYTFILREGLSWHDGAKVTAEDCVASIQRWASQDQMGQLLFQNMEELKVIDDMRFELTMKFATDLALHAFAKPSSLALFMMPKRVAQTPPTEIIREYIGSGPFKLVEAEFQAGVQIVYEKNTAYVPRVEPASGLAGGKHVYVERVKWIASPDSMTAVNALINNEIDYFELVPLDLEPLLRDQPEIRVTMRGIRGGQIVMRMNHLHPPFDNKLIRRAAMLAVGQEAALQAAIGNPAYYSFCAAVFGCGTPYASEAGADIVIKAQPERAQALLKEAGYDGTPVIILQPTDTPVVNPHPVVIAQALRAAGFNVTLQAMDWQTVVTRRAMQTPPHEGGWNIFSTNIAIAETMDPLRAYSIAANGKAAWPGWPDVPEIERLRAAFLRTTDETQRQAYAERIQELAIEEGVILPMGEYNAPAAYRNTLSEMVVASVPTPTFWHVRKQ